jgi:transposase
VNANSAGAYNARGSYSENGRKSVLVDALEASRVTRGSPINALSDTLAFCQSHLETPVREDRAGGTLAPTPIAGEALERIAQLYTGMA